MDFLSQPLINHFSKWSCKNIHRKITNRTNFFHSMKSFLAKRGVKEEILSFDARRISNQSRETVERLLQQRSNSFNPDVAKKASAAAAPLAIWYFYKFIMSYLTVTIRLRNNRQNQNICVTFWLMRETSKIDLTLTYATCFQFSSKCWKNLFANIRK